MRGEERRSNLSGFEIPDFSLSDMATGRFYYITMAALVLVLGYLTYQIVKPFLAPLTWAVVLSILFYPVYDYLLRYVRWKSAAALIVLFIIILIIIGPFSYFSYLLVSEIQDILSHTEKGQLGSLRNFAEHPAVKQVLHNIGTSLHIPYSEAELQKTIVDNVSRFGKQLIAQIPSGVGNILSLIVNFVFMSLATFFMLRDGSDFLGRARNYMPFSESQKNRLAAQIRDIVVSTIYGGAVVAIVQGIIGGIAYALLGLRSPALWGLGTAIASFVPLLGTFAVWGAITVYFLLAGEYGRAVILLLVGMFGISMIDNILRPVLVGARTKMHILVIFFSALGGIQFFGLIGLILGPLVVALFISVVEIFRQFEGGHHA